tara:strand:- start:1403 stop:2848 length:1446 start_codon:yes stop_codon:yes gene_type:complete
LFRNTNLYFLANIYSVLVAFLLLPIYTKFLSPEEFGILAIYVLFGNVLSNLFAFGLSSATSRYYFKFNDNVDEFKKYNSTNFFFFNTFLLFGFIIVFLFGDFIAQKIFDGKVTKNLLFISYLSGYITRLFSYFGKILHAQKKALFYCIIEIIKTSTIAIISSILLIKFSFSYDARIIAEIIGLSLPVILMLVYLFKYFVRTISISRLKISLKYSLPSIPSQILNYINQSFDKTMINKLNSLGELGFYELSSKIGMVSRMVNDSVGYAWVPYFYDNMKSNNHKNINNRFITMFCFFTFMNIGVILFCKEMVVILINPQFYPIINIIPFIVASIYIQNSLSTLYIVQIQYSEKTLYILPITVVSVIINIGFNIILIPKYGAMGAALALLITSIISSFIGLLVGRMLLRINIEYTKLLLLISIFASIFLYMIYFNNLEFSIIEFILKIILLILYLFISIKLKFISFNDLNLIFQKLKIKNVFAK